MHAGTMLLHPHGILPMWAAVRGAAGGPRDSPEAHGGLEQTNSAGNELSSRAQDHSQGSQVTQVRFGDARMVFVLISFLVCVCGKFIFELFSRDKVDDFLRRSEEKAELDVHQNLSHLIHVNI